MSKMPNDRIKAEWVIIGLVVISCGWLLFDNYQSRKNRSLELPEDLPTISLNDSVKFDQNWFRKKYKVVAFIKRDLRALYEEWDKYIQKYPDVGFLFYVVSTDKKELMNALKLYTFHHPVIFDANGEFEKENPAMTEDLTFISFIVNEKGEVISLGNPSLPESFERRLNALSQ